MQVILGGEQLCQVAPEPQSHPSVSGVVHETPGVGKSEDAGPVQPEEVVPEVVEIEESEEEMVVSEVQEATATPPHAESCATDVTPVPSLAFTTLSSSSLSVGLTTTGSVTGSHIVPPASSPRPSRDPILAEPSPVGPPRPTRSLSWEFTPITPSRTLPPLASIPPENRAAAATVVGTVPDRETLLTWLREVDGQRLALDIARANLMCELSVLESESLRETRMELDAAQQRCRLLEDQLRRYRTQADPALEMDGDLEAICSSHALLLLPNRGRTSMYHLTQDDLVHLDIPACDPALSCERL